MSRSHIKRIVVALLIFVAEGQAAPKNEIRGLQLKVEQLSTTVAALERRLQQLENHAVLPAELKAAIAAPADRLLASTAQSENAKATSKAPPSPDGTSRFGLNGEFRLYFDSITRPAGGDAPRVSNIRGRYLLHLDFNAALQRTLSVHARLSTSPINNPLTDIQDFGGGVAKHPFFLSEAYVDFHPNANLRLQGGRVDSPFNDRSRFLFDIDTRFNGTNEIFKIPVKNNFLGLSQIQFLAGQYTFTNPNFPIIGPETPSTAANATPSQALLASGAKEGTQPRASQLFQQGVLLDGNLTSGLTHQAGFDLQLYRNPNQLRLMSTTGGLFLIGSSLGLTPFSPVPSASNATTTAGGANLTAPGFRIAHLTYTVAHRGVAISNWTVPLSLNFQLARNVEKTSDRNAFAAIGSIGRSREAGDFRVLYGFFRKEANSLVGELTENDIAIGGNVNMHSNVLRTEYTIGRGVVFANNFIFTKWLKDSNPAAHFFVPLGSRVPLQFRYQGMLIFRF